MTPLQSFSASGPLEFVQILILGLLPKVVHVYQFVLVIAECNPNLTIASLMSKTIELHIASLFVENWIVVHGVPSVVLTHDYLQFVRKFLKLVCALSGTKHLMPMLYQKQKDGQTERFSMMVVAGVRRYGANHQRDWDIFLHLWGLRITLRGIGFRAWRHSVWFYSGTLCLNTLNNVPTLPRYKKENRKYIPARIESETATSNDEKAIWCREVHGRKEETLQRWPQLGILPCVPHVKHSTVCIHQFSSNDTICGRASGDWF